MKHRLIAMAAAFLLSLTPLTASASHVILIEPEVNLKDYTTSYTALKEAEHIMYSGNQVLIHWELPVMAQGCEIVAGTMEWEVSGTADVTFETDSFFKSVSYEENYANTYCLITANSPGSVHVVGTEYSLYDSNGTEFYFNFTVDADGNFDETVDMDNPIEPVIAEDSVYFPNPDAPCQFDLLVSSNLECTVTHDKDGCTFTPEEDGRYVVSTRAYCEEIVNFGESGHFHYFYPVLHNYTVAVKDGKITVTEKGSRSWYSEKQISKEVTAINELLSSGDIEALACFDVYAAEPDDVMHGAYFSFINGYLPSVQGYYKSYITNVYTEYGTDSYFCVNHFYSDIVPVEPRVQALETDITHLLTEFTTASTCNGDLTACSPDMMQLTRIYADETLEGDLTVVVDGKEEYLLTVEDGIFRHRKAASELMGDCNNDGKFTVTDLVMLRKFLLGTGELTAPQNADMCTDGTLDAFDLAIMKRELLRRN